MIENMAGSQSPPNAGQKGQTPSDATRSSGQIFSMRDPERKALRDTPSSGSRQRGR